MVSLTELHLRAARARIAAAVVPQPVEPRLGTILLRDAQCASAARAAAMIEREGGCLLADDVGRGKTYVALALARRWARPLVVAPASLRTTWFDAMARAEVPCCFVSHEALSRGRRTEGDSPDGVIVDESHRFRSTDARRYSELAAMTMQSRLLLLSATPLQNRPRDLAAQVALFHGVRAFQLDEAGLARFVVRSAARSDDDLPRIAAPEWLHPGADDERVLEAILALPPPARPSDGGDAGVLRTISLVRAWASSRAALRAALRRRRRIATAIEQSAAAGLVPTRRELGAWAGDDGAIQLAFARLLVAGSADDSSSALVRVVEREQEALGGIERTLKETADPDEERVRTIRELRRRHAGRSILAFTELATTARAYFSRLSADGGLGLLTANEARIASGRLAREELLVRFAPHAHHAISPAPHERVTLLIATDLLSEGMNLQDASVVVHLDLPWNPARLAQRVGRVRRPGGAPIVHSYLIAAPARAELLLDVEGRLRRKLADARRTIGHGFDVVPCLSQMPPTRALPDGHAAIQGEVVARIARWAQPARRLERGCRAIVAAVECMMSGWLAALDDGRLISSIDDALPDHDVIALAVWLCELPSRPLRMTSAERAMCECAARLSSEQLAIHCGRLDAPLPLDLAMERQISVSLAQSSRHERSATASRARHLRALLGAPRPIGMEHALKELLDRAQRDRGASWMIEASALLRRQGRRSTPETAPRIVALVVFG